MICDDGRYHWTRWAVEISPGCNSRDGQPHRLGFDTGCDFQRDRLSHIGSRGDKRSRPCQKQLNQNTLSPLGHHLRCNQCHSLGIHRQSCFSCRKLQLPKEQWQSLHLSEQRCPWAAPSWSSRLGCCQTQFESVIRARTFGSYPAPWRQRGGSWIGSFFQ